MPGDTSSSILVGEVLLFSAKRRSPAMEVHFEPDVQTELDRIARESGRAAADPRAYPGAGRRPGSGGLQTWLGRPLDRSGDRGSLRPIA